MVEIPPLWVSQKYVIGLKRSPMGTIKDIVDHHFMVTVYGNFIMKSAIQIGPDININWFQEHELNESIIILQLFSLNQSIYQLFGGKHLSCPV